MFSTVHCPIHLLPDQNMDTKFWDGPLTAEAKISNHHLYGKWVIMQNGHNENIMEKVYQHMLTQKKL